MSAHNIGVIEELKKSKLSNMVKYSFSLVSVFQY